MKKLGFFQITLLAAFLVVVSFIAADSAQACDYLDGWYNVGSPYSCCEGEQSCECQDQEYRNYNTVCTGWGQTCTAYQTVCAEEGQCCSGYAERCVAWGEQTCLDWQQVCSRYEYQCSQYTTYCSEYTYYCTEYTTYCSVYVQTQNCYCDGAMFLGICIGSYVCTPYEYCAAYSTYCSRYEPFCTQYSTYCSQYTQVCTELSLVCSVLYLPCAQYETYCTGYYSCCLRTEEVCTNWQPYCTGYGCDYSVTDTRTVQSGCSLVDGQCGYFDNSPPDRPTPGGEGGGGIPGGGGAGETWNHCSIQGKSVPVFAWNYSDPDGDPQAAYEIEVDNNAAFAAPKFNHLVNSPSTSYALDLSHDDDSDWISELAWNTTYFWRVRVKDSPGNWSEWMTPDELKTPFHAYPWPDFEWIPQEPNQGEAVLFDPDSSQAYGGTEISSYLWTITEGAGEFLEDTDSSSQYPYVSFSTADNKMRLRVTDSDGYSCQSSIKDITAQLPLPEYQEAIPVSWVRQVLASIADFMDFFLK